MQDSLNALYERFDNRLPTGKRVLRSLDTETLSLIASRFAMDEAHMRGHGGMWYRAARLGRKNIEIVFAERASAAQTAPAAK